MALQTVISSSRIPLVIIIGATGTGKTKLGVELAHKFRTEIISADSMQIYKGLDIVTAKATQQEQEAIPHHLLDILEPNQKFTVVDFRNRALKIIDRLTKEGKIPLVVGGTAYYMESIVYQILVENTTETESLLWDRSKRKRDIEKLSEEPEAKKIAIDKSDDDHTEVATATGSEQPASETDDKAEKSEGTVSKEQLQEFLDNEEKFSNEDIHSKLKLVDPEMANRLHKNNRRKILRSLYVWLESGRRHSDILDKQKLVEGKLRKPGDTLIFWLKCEPYFDPISSEGHSTLKRLCSNTAPTQYANVPQKASVHDERLNSRVDAMLERGLIQELLDFHANHNKERIEEGNAPDYTKGIFQTLGFKEFHKYLIMSETERESEQGKKLLEQSIDNMKLSTRRYARRQNKMIRGRFLNHPHREIPLIYELDTTDVSSWDETVKNKAIKIIESHVNGSECEYEPLISQIDEEVKTRNTKSNNYCTICHRSILGDQEYSIHMQSIKHGKMVRKLKAQEKLAASKVKPE